MCIWQSIEGAPTDGSPFLALNFDREVWVARIVDGRLQYRTNARCEPRRYEVVRHNGEELLREDKEFARNNEHWRSGWTIWSRLYEFKPVKWAPLPVLAAQPIPHQDRIGGET